MCAPPWKCKSINNVSVRCFSLQLNVSHGSPHPAGKLSQGVLGGMGDI